METTQNSVVQRNLVMAQLGVAGVPAQGCYARPWASHAVGVVSIAPKASLRLEQKSAPMTPAVDATPRKDVFARSGIRTQGPPV